MQVSFSVINERKKIVEINCGTKTCQFQLKIKRAFAVLIKLLELYPKRLDIHKHLKQYKDPNKAYNDLKNVEGYEPYIVESKNSKNTMELTLQVQKLCRLCNALNGEPIYLGLKDHREVLKPVDQEFLVKKFNGRCNITHIRLSNKCEFDNKTFAKSLMVINYDHRKPKFKGGSEDLENYQILSDYANREKNKVCKSCSVSECEKCALAWPEKNDKIYPTGQDLKKFRGGGWLVEKSTKLQKLHLVSWRCFGVYRKNRKKFSSMLHYQSYLLGQATIY